MYTLLVTIMVDNFDAFEEFEHTASKIMKKYNGLIEKAFEIERDKFGKGKELHIVQFPNKEAFDNYRNDEELLRLKEVQLKAISKMDVMVLGAQKVYG